MMCKISKQTSNGQTPFPAWMSTIFGKYLHHFLLFHLCPVALHSSNSQIREHAYWLKICDSQSVLLWLVIQILPTSKVDNLYLARDFWNTAHSATYKHYQSPLKKAVCSPDFLWQAKGALLPGVSQVNGKAWELTILSTEVPALAWNKGQRHLWLLFVQREFYCRIHTRVPFRVKVTLAVHCPLLSTAPMDLTTCS